MEKSHVGMETKICIVCGKEEESGAILLDKRLRATLERHTCTGLGMCKSCTELKAKGYVALIGIDPDRSEIRGGKIKPESVWRTGDVIHMKVEVAKDIFQITDETAAGGVMYVDKGTIDGLKRHMGQGSEDEETR